MRELKDIITNCPNKEYGYRIKLARDCSRRSSKLESCFYKSITLLVLAPWKRLSQENPIRVLKD